MITWMQLELNQIHRGTKVGEVPTNRLLLLSSPLTLLLFSKYSTRWRTPRGTLLQGYDGELKLKCVGVLRGVREAPFIVLIGQFLGEIRAGTLITAF